MVISVSSPDYLSKFLNKRIVQGQKLWNRLRAYRDVDVPAASTIEGLLTLAHTLGDYTQTTVEFYENSRQGAAQPDGFENILSFYQLKELHHKQVSYTTYSLAEQLKQPN